MPMRSRTSHSVRSVLSHSAKANMPRSRSRQPMPHSAKALSSTSVSHGAERGEHPEPRREQWPHGAWPMLQIIGRQVVGERAFGKTAEQGVELAVGIGLGADALEMMPQHIGEAAPRLASKQPV